MPSRRKADPVSALVEQRYRAFGFPSISGFAVSRRRSNYSAPTCGRRSITPKMHEVAGVVSPLTVGCATAMVARLAADAVDCAATRRRNEWWSRYGNTAGVCPQGRAGC